MQDRISKFHDNLKLIRKLSENMQRFASIRPRTKSVKWWPACLPPPPHSTNYVCESRKPAVTESKTRCGQAASLLRSWLGCAYFMYFCWGLRFSCSVVLATNSRRQKKKENSIFYTNLSTKLLVFANFSQLAPLCATFHLCCINTYLCPHFFHL